MLAPEVRNHGAGKDQKDISVPNTDYTHTFIYKCVSILNSISQIDTRKKRRCQISSLLKKLTPDTLMDPG